MRQVQVQCRLRKIKPPIDALVHFLLSAMEVLDVTDGEVGVRISTDRVVRGCNRKFAQKNKSTDVLSFPDSGEGDYLGDILISGPQAETQARTMGHSLGEEISRLALHGLIHLLGYDHETDHGEMMALEEKTWVDLMANRQP